MTYSKVSIIILNWNGLKDTIECLESLKKITYPNYEVIVVDNGSEGNDADILEEQYKDYIRVIRNKENLGFTGGNNIGIRKVLEEGKSEYILLLNNDTVVEPNFLDELVKVAVQNKEIAIVGSVVADYYTKKIVFTNAKIDKKLKGKIKLDYLNLCKDYWETEIAHGASIMIKSEYILKYNLFLDENLFLYCDEIDICWRVKKHNLKIVIAGKSKIYHKESQSTGGKLSALSVYYVLRNRILLSKKLLNFKEQILFWILFIPSRLIRVFEWMIKGRWNLIRITYFAFLDGILNKKGKTSRKLN